MHFQERVGEVLYCEICYERACRSLEPLATLNTGNGFMRKKDDINDLLSKHGWLKWRRDYFGVSDPYVVVVRKPLYVCTYRTTEEN